MKKYFTLAGFLWMVVATIALGVMTCKHVFDCSIHGDWFALALWAFLGSIAFSLVFAGTLALIPKLMKL